MIYIFALYVLGFIAFYSHIRVLHSPKGKYSELPPDTEDVVMCFILVINISFAIIGWLFDWPYKQEEIKKEKKVRNYKRFFGIKQPKQETIEDLSVEIEELNRYIAARTTTRNSNWPPYHHNLTNNDTTIEYPKKFSLKSKKTI